MFHSMPTSSVSRQCTLLPIVFACETAVVQSYPRPDARFFHEKVMMVVSQKGADLCEPHPLARNSSNKPMHGPCMDGDVMKQA